MLLAFSISYAFWTYTGRIKTCCHFFKSRRFHCWLLILTTFGRLIRWHNWCFLYIFLDRISAFWLKVWKLIIFWWPTAKCAVEKYRYELDAGMNGRSCPEDLWSHIDLICGVPDFETRFQRNGGHTEQPFQLIWTYLNQIVCFHFWHLCDLFMFCLLVCFCQLREIFKAKGIEHLFFYCEEIY